MEISKKSWHYRLLGKFNAEEDLQGCVSFCNYFWELILTLLFIVFLVIMVVFCSISAVCVFAEAFGDIVEYCYSDMSGSFAIIMTLFVSLTIAAIIFCIAKYGGNMLSYFKNLANKIELCRILMVHYRAFKEKHCPIVNFKD